MFPNIHHLGDFWAKAGVYLQGNVWFKCMKTAWCSLLCWLDAFRLFLMRAVDSLWQGCVSEWQFRHMQGDRGGSVRAVRPGWPAHRGVMCNNNGQAGSGLPAADCHGTWEERQLCDIVYAHVWCQCVCVCVSVFNAKPYEVKSFTYDRAVLLFCFSCPMLYWDVIINNSSIVCCPLQDSGLIATIILSSTEDDTTQGLHSP